MLSHFSWTLLFLLSIPGTSWADIFICTQWLHLLLTHLRLVYNSTICRSNRNNSLSPTALCIYCYWLSFVFMLPFYSAVLRLAEIIFVWFFYFNMINVLGRFPFWHQMHAFLQVYFILFLTPLPSPLDFQVHECIENGFWGVAYGKLTVEKNLEKNEKPHPGASMICRNSSLKNEVEYLKVTLSAFFWVDSFFLKKSFLH